MIVRAFKREIESHEMELVGLGAGNVLRHGVPSMRNHCVGYCFSRC